MQKSKIPISHCELSTKVKMSNNEKIPPIYSRKHEATKS